MKFEIPPIVKPLDLGDYAEELRGVIIYVWVNCPPSFQSRYYELLREMKELPQRIKNVMGEEKTEVVNSAGERMAAWVAELWTKGAGADMWTFESITELANSDTDPALYPWALNRSWALIHDHRDRSKKK